VLLLEPAQTPYDLRFRLFGVSVRVHPMFWLVMAILGWGGGPREEGKTFLFGLLAWVAACFVSVLIHELGHVFMGRLFGCDGYIVLYSFGGLAVGSNALASGRKRALVSFAGPLAQFILLGIVVVVLWFAYFPPIVRELLSELPSYHVFVATIYATIPNEILARFFHAMIFINLFWPLLNLLPIWPLDGGHIAREACAGALGDRGLRVSLGISMVVSALLALNALAAIHKADGTPLIPGLRGKPLIPYIGDLFAGGWFMVIFFVLFAIQSLQLLQAAEAERRWRDDHWQD
jgi:stage IV sporulation protein FB